MKSHRSISQRILTAASLLTLLAGTTNLAHAEWPKLRVTMLGKQYVYRNGGFVYEGPYGVHLRKPTRKKSNVQRARIARGEQFDDLNLEVNVPGEPWVRLDPEEHGTRACLLLSRQDPDLIVSLAVKPVGVEVDETSASVLAASQEKMKSLPGGEVQPGVRKLSAPGLVGRTYRASATFDDGTKLQYSLWVATKNGYNYTLAVYGDPRYKQSIDQTMRYFVGRLRQIEPTRIAHVDGETTVRR